MTRRFLLFVHTRREAAIEALHHVLREMAIDQVEAVMLTDQIDELRTADPSVLPEGLPELLSAGHVRVVRDVAEAGPIELGIVLGGDGTILRALEAARGADFPIHGVNLGHVGFLAESEAADLTETVDRLLARAYEIEERSTLDVAVIGTDRSVVARDFCINDASLEKRDRQRMINAVLEIDGRPVSAFGCDGVIVSTSTGSTAYAFSAGGPVVWPEVDSFLIVPNAAHALFARPLVLGRSSVAAIEIPDEDRDGGVLFLDGRRTHLIDPGMRVEVRLSEQKARLARLSTTPFADRLVERFRLPVTGWRGRRTEGA